MPATARRTALGRDVPRTRPGHLDGGRGVPVPGTGAVRRGRHDPDRAGARGRGGGRALGPEDGAWRLFDTPSATAPAPAPERPAPGSPEPARLVERMTDRRHQVLVAGLSTAGLYDLGPEDDAAVRALAERLDEPTVRRVAHWLSAAGGRQ
ncbi:hypothetical protein LT493_15775 [Streptomyces tricolor]|nr:hypothetical protein [Streptomyces tricolor]